MSLHITNTTKSAILRPTTRDSLRSIIEHELKRQGPDTNLNHVDVSQITDMRMLFCGLDVHKIKISDWDVSNVTNMCAMFDGCVGFNCDLSNWNVTTCGTRLCSISKCRDMFCMFAGCSEFNCDLSSWNMLSEKDTYCMFSPKSYNHRFTSDNL